MITAFRRLQTNSAYYKSKEWIKLISITGSAQVIVQAVSFISGILIIRLLPAEEYGFYTLANTMLGTMTLLSDTGISASVMAQGGKVWQDKQKLGIVLATGVDLRKKFALISLLISLPVLAYLLIFHGASILTAILISLSLIPAFLAALSDNLLQIVPKLNQCIPQLQKNQVMVSGLRFVLSALFLFVFPFTFIAILASGFPRIYGNLRLRKIVNQFVDSKQKPNKEIRSEILKVVKKVFPGAIYYCLSGQITIWLVSFFGNSRSIAELGVLSRLAMVLTLFSVIVNTLIIPRFARLEDNKEKLFKRFIQIVTILTFLGISIVSLVWVFHGAILFLLGEQYYNLSDELIIFMVGSCIVFIWGTIYTLCSSRGWIINPAFTIITNIGSLVLGIYLFDISTITGILYLNIFIGLIELAYHSGYALLRIWKIK
jgi:O-antigen/teichoic acid export membrane protein